MDIKCLRCDQERWAARCSHCGKLFCNTCDKIKSLEAERDTAIKEMNKHARDAGKLEAENLRLKEVVEAVSELLKRNIEGGFTHYRLADLQEALKGLEVE